MRAGTLAAVVLAGGVAVGFGAHLATAPPAAPVAPVPTSTTTTGSTTTTAPPAPGPHGTTVGLTMFRGNPTRSWYGTGPLSSSAPAVAWTYPQAPMCGTSVVGGEASRWCGTGWTGQPAVWERPDGVTEVVFGAYDKAVHFVDAATGADTRAPFPVGDIIKGSVTVDPDGFPLLYTGSRDGKLRVLALDREPVVELWALEASSVAGMWNDDWDGNPVVVDDVLYEGGENSWFFAVRLHRGYGADGKVTVSPDVVFSLPGWTDELVAAVGRNVSIESSVAVAGNRAYFANSGGRVVGVDLDRALAGVGDPVVFDYWMGDDTDATIVVDSDGALYVAAELERGTDRSAEVGQLVKLDPSAAGDPRVWGIAVPGVDGDGGLWATPALAGGYLYAATHPGRLLAVDTASGEVTWEADLGWHAWSSPVVVDGVLLVATCETAELRAFSLADPARPAPLWTLPAAGGCIESTPAVWEGRIYVGSRDGYVRAYAAGPSAP